LRPWQCRRVSKFAKETADSEVWKAVANVYRVNIKHPTRWYGKNYATVAGKMQSLKGSLRPIKIVLEFETFQIKYV